MPSKPILRLSRNEKGKDYVIGDIHGCYSMLEHALEAVGFDHEIDRLFCCGDLVDRGPESPRVLEFLEKPWFFSVMGNHDLQYAFPNGYRGHSTACLPIDPWFNDLSDAAFAVLSDRLRELPFVIEVETEDFPIAIVHAGVPVELEWEEFLYHLEMGNFFAINAAMWERECAIFAATKEAHLKAGLSEHDFHLGHVRHVFHGHTPLRAEGYRPYHLANRYFIDTGACFSLGDKPDVGAALTLFDLEKPGEPVYRLTGEEFKAALASSNEVLEL